MFTVRAYTEDDASACGDCFYEGFFDCPEDDNDRRLLRDYAQVLIEKCDFAYVAEAGDGQVVGFVCGRYGKGFRKERKVRPDTGRHYGLWCRMFIRFYTKGYGTSPAFQGELDAFLRQLRERDAETFGGCDLELVALSSRRDYRGGLGTALVARFLERAESDGAKSIRLFTNTLASWQFYEKRGFTKVAEKPFGDGSGNRSLVYEYLVGDGPGAPDDGARGL